MAYDEGITIKWLTTATVIFVAKSPRAGQFNAIHTVIVLAHMIHFVQCLSNIKAQYHIP